MAREAFVTLATNDRYCEGALVVAQSLRRHKTRREIVVLITPQVSTICRSRLSVLFDHVIVVDVLDSNDEAHLALLHRPELGVTFTKLHCWRLVQYTKCVFLDADTLVLTNVDELFERNELSASPDAGWPDMFNSGVFVFTPSMETYNDLIKLADTDGSFDGGDQGLLNSYFSEWSTSDTSKRLPFLYNMHSTATYTYSPAFAQYGKDTKIVHFIGFVKPWNHKYDEKTGEVTQVEGPGIHEETLVKQWWKVWAEVQGLEGMRKTTTVEYKGAENPPNYGGQPDSVHEVKKEAQLKLESQKQHLQQWQSSNVDYAGADSFDHIQAKLDTVLQLDDTVNKKS
uniref:glycogenin glucosyltransferase n=1 Tax=Ciona intestinalis TaxID=7719 RepID=H2XKC9_CIOIN|nr:glycogenin-1 isoform X1 [Ciona intestinalis]|eukprot:XP_026693838.1 glycogenin-1 isoform X1 [Ciona intestinalis]